MQVKILEVRDSATFIPVIAVPLAASNLLEYRLLRSQGFAYGTLFIMVTRLNDSNSRHDPYAWCDRTMSIAHKYIAEHYYDLVDGDVIDVEYILGETTTKKEPQ